MDIEKVIATAIIGALVAVIASLGAAIWALIMVVNHFT